MKFWNHKKLLVLAFFAIIAVLLGIISFRTRGPVRVRPHSVTDISDGWTLNNKGVTTKNVNVSTADISVVNEKEMVLISRTLEDLGADNLCLSFYSIHSIVYVYLDHELIYSYGKNYYDAKSIVPKKHHYIPLGSGYQGKLLTISYTGTFDGCFSGLSPVTIGTRHDLHTEALYSAKTGIVSGFFMFTLGLMLITLSPYLFLYHNRDLRIFFSGLISLMLGTFILSYYGIFDLLVNNDLLNTFLEYASLYNIPTAILGYLMSTFSGKEKKCFKYMFIFDVVLFLSSAVLHYTKLKLISAFTPVLHVAAASEFFLSTVIIANYYKNKKKDLIPGVAASESFFLGGIIAFMFLSLVDIGRYDYLKYRRGTGEANISLTGFTLGALIFVFCLLVSYLLYNIFSPNIDYMQSQMINLAYTDPLTGLSNRARCEQMITMLTEEHATYTIISLDLNKLKQVNDTLGHHEGDRLITGFSTILTDCFWDANLIGRMGGDEFIVILLEDRALNVTRRIHELYALINEWNHKEQNFKYSVSYGYAYSYEVPSGSAQEVYMLADNRMYEMKREHQAQDEGVVTV